jgi:hypothetical protein
MSWEENTGQNQNMSVDSKFFENVTEPKYLMMTLTDQNCKREEIKGS